MRLGGYHFWLGASADADPALVASDQAAARLAPTGVDPLRCSHPYSYIIKGAPAGIVSYCYKCGERLP